MRKIIDTTGGGLRKLKKDGDDFRLAALFKQVQLSTLPIVDFDVAIPLAMKDQGDTDFCFAFASTEVSEDQEGIELLPEYQAFKAKQISGDLKGWGCDLRSVCKSLVNPGSLPKEGNEKYIGLPREQVLDPATWPAELDKDANIHRKSTFFDATYGRYDLFDNLRVALWQHRKDKCTILTGSTWRQAWTDAADGVVPTMYPTLNGYGHAFKLYGQRIINSVPYIKAQLSNGTDIGDRGKFYFPREVINREFKDYGAFMFKDIDRATAEAMLNSGTIIDMTQKSIWSPITKFFSQFLP